MDGLAVRGLVSSRGRDLPIRSLPLRQRFPSILAMSATKNIFAALSDDSTPKSTQTQGKKKTKKKSTPISLHEPIAPVVPVSAPRHPLRSACLPSLFDFAFDCP